MKVDTLTSSDDAAAAMDRRILEQLLMMMMVHSLLQKEGTDDDGDALKKMARECMAANKREQSGVAMAQLLVVAERMSDAQLLRLLDGGLKGREELSSDATSDQQLMDTSPSSRNKMDRHVLDKMIQSFLRSDENDAHEMCQDIKNTVEEYLVLNRAQLSVSERLLAVNEQLLAAQLRSLEANDNNSAAPAVDQLMVAADTAARDSSVAKKNKKAAKKKRNELKRAAAKKQKNEYVPWLNGGINTHLLMVIIGSFMTLLIMSLIPQSDGSKGASPPSFPPTAFLRHRRVREGINAVTDTDSLITMEKSSIFSTSSSSAPLPPSSALSSSINECVDTPNWKDADGNGCNYYEENEDRRCPSGGSAVHDGGMGVARDNCCYCKDSSWKDLKESCLRSLMKGEAEFCDEAASSICDATHEVKVLPMPNGNFETVGLYNKCKCDFWILMCEHEDTDMVPCDYAVEYCCGDYEYSPSEDTFYYLNSPACYCDFQDDLVDEHGYNVKPQTINVTSEFTDACDQFKYEWLQSHTHEDEKKSLEAMYARLGGENWIDKDGWMTDTDNCEWFGISCDEDGYVTRVDLGGNNLVGQFPVYTRDDPIGNSWRTSKYGLANLYKLAHLDLANNNLTGTIEYAPLYNLQELEYFNISRNNLTGEADALVGPKVEYADFANNAFTSMRRFETYKYEARDLLWWCDVSNNNIRQDANDLLWHLPKMERFIASNNNIRGTLPEWQSLNYLDQLREFRMASNYISGELPSFFNSHTTFQHLDMSHQKKNGLTGTIPEDLWRAPLITLNLAGNSLTGTITPLVGDLAVMKEFDLSNNRLIGAIPSEVGMLAGKLKVFNLDNNAITGSIPSQLGSLQGASIYLKGNLFNDVNRPAPLSLCALRAVKAFDLESDPKLCPSERNALNDFFDEAEGGEWVNDSMWQDEYASYCSWNGVTCDETDHVIKLKLSTNGLSGKLSRSIANLTSLEELDLSNNDMKGPIPADLGLLSNLSYLRLSYNVFTGTAPAGLGDMKRLQLLQLQSNRITGMPNVPRLTGSNHGLSTFVTDCGVPSDFEEALACANCTMCCNAYDDCYPQQETKVLKSGLKDYGTFSGILAVLFFVFCCIATLLLYVFDRYKDSDTNFTRRSSSAEMRSRHHDDVYALSAIGKDSVYKYFASEMNLQDDKIDIQFTWKCPPDTDTCENQGDLDGTGWAIFSVLMIAFLGKDFISGAKLIAHSAKCRNGYMSRLRYFVGGICLGWITVFILYVSTIYNKALATSNSDIVVNSVVILFIMEIDEKIFSALAAINEKWTTHAAESEDLIIAESAAKNDKGNSIDEMKVELANQKEEIEAQRKEIRMLREAVLDIQEAKEPSEASF